MLNLLLIPRLSLACVIVLLFAAFARCATFVEHVGFLAIPPNDNVSYYLRVSGTEPRTLLVWLGHTPGQAINYRLNDSAIPPFAANFSLLMADLPGVGRTQSNRQVNVDSLASFMSLVIKNVTEQYRNYSFRSIWVGGEKYMTPLATTLARVHKGVVGLVLGNPYLEGRLTVPKRFEIVKHFGLLDIKKEQQFSFLNDLCMRNTTLASCSRVERLFDMVTNRSTPSNRWGEQYLSSVLDRPNYLGEFVDLMRSHVLGLLMYTGQLDLNAGFQRVFSVLQKHSVCSQPESLTYYMRKTETRGFFTQNDCWTLLELYNASANVSHTQSELLVDTFSEFMENKRLKCVGPNCGMEAEIKQHFPNCAMKNWRSNRYVCTCNNGRYGINCDMEVPQRTEDEGFRHSLDPNEVTYVKFVVTGTGYLLLEPDNNCSIDMYANVYSADDQQSFDLPNMGRHDMHSRTNRMHIFVQESQKTTVVLKLQSRTADSCNVVLTYNEYRTQPVAVYAVLASSLAVATVLLIVAMIYVRKKLWPQNPTLRSSLIEPVKE